MCLEPRVVFRHKIKIPILLELCVKVVTEMNLHTICFLVAAEFILRAKKYLPQMTLLRKDFLLTLGALQIATTQNYSYLTAILRQL